MSLNYDALKNVTPLDVNVSRLGAGEQIPENLRNYTRDVVGSNWINFTSFGLFVMLILYYNVRKQYTLSQSVFMASAWSFVVVFGFLISGFSKNIYPLFFYGTIMFLSWWWMHTNKKKGLDG